MSERMFPELPVNEELKRALENAEPMTPEQREAQRQSFAYGNTKLANEDITREMLFGEAGVKVEAGGEHKGCTCPICTPELWNAGIKGSGDAALCGISFSTGFWIAESIGKEIAELERERKETKCLPKTE